MTGEIDLTGSIAIVTGGGRGIGRAIALGLARCGARVAVTARSHDEIDETVALAESAGGTAIAVAGDIAEPSDVDALVNEVRRRFGDVDLLVNNAGTVDPIGPTWDCDPDEWWRGVEINVRGPFLCTQAVLPAMIANRRGRIITVVSGYAVKSAPYFSAYGASKVACMRLTDTLAAEVGEYGITAFALNPGTVRTAMTDHMRASPSMQKWIPEYREGVQARYRPPEDTTDLVEFLASGRADRLTGRIIDVSLDDVRDMVERADEIVSEDLYALRLWKT